MNRFFILLIDSFYTLSHNIIILISSYPFISLINCPWLLFHGIILLSFYCIFFDCIYFVDAFSLLKAGINADRITDHPCDTRRTVAPIKSNLIYNHIFRPAGRTEHQICVFLDILGFLDITNIYILLD